MKWRPKGTGRCVVDWFGIGRCVGVVVDGFLKIWCVGVDEFGKYGVLALMILENMVLALMSLENMVWF